MRRKRRTQNKGEWKLAIALLAAFVLFGMIRQATQTSGLNSLVVERTVAE